MIRIRQLTIEATRVRKLITYKKAVTGVYTEESDDSYAYYMNLIPQKGEDERKTRSLIGQDSYTRLTGLMLEDLGFNLETMIDSSDDEDDFDRDYKISKKDRRKEHIQKARLSFFFKSMVYLMVEGVHDAAEKNRVKREKQRQIELKQIELEKYQASKTGIIKKFREELSPEQYGGLLQRNFTILEPVKPATEFVLPIDVSRYKYNDWRTIYEKSTPTTNRTEVGLTKTVVKQKVGNNTFRYGARNSQIQGSSRNNFSTMLSSPVMTDCLSILNKKGKQVGLSTQVSLASGFPSPSLKVKPQLKNTSNRPITAKPLKQKNY